MKHKLLKSALCLCLLLPACDNQQKSTTDSKAPEKTTPAAPEVTKKPDNKVLKTMDAGGDKTPAPAVMEQQSDTISGKVLETMDAGGYTYMKVDTGKAQPWVACPQAQVKVGDDVSYHDGMVMPNFVSKSLNRTFDSVVFSSGLVSPTDKTPAQADPQSMNSAVPKTAGADSFDSAVKNEAPPAAMQAESGGSVGAIAPFTEIKVEKAAGENGYTVAEVFADSTKLDGKTIRVQAKVIKFSPNIMGKNWIHLQDGSGDPLNNTHDLVITTSAEAPKGKDVITIEGIVRTNKDFGAGYSYVVIVEEAKIIK